MSRNSSARFALLGLLTLKPMTGYEMRKFIDASISFFWRESYGNIYPILRKLSKDGLVETREERQSGRPDRKIYKLTAEGRSKFREWQRLPAEPEYAKSELLLKLFFGTKMRTGEVRILLDDYGEQQSLLLSTYDNARRQIKLEAKDDPSQMFWLMTLRRGEMVAQARLAWVNECLKLVGRMRATGSAKKRKANGTGGKKQ